jgi:hypothetical protein
MTARDGALRWRFILSVEEWQAVCEDTRKWYQSGRFLIERLGAGRFLDPQLMATLWQLRQGLLEEYGTTSPAMTMVIDLAVMTYYNALRIQGWVGDLSLVIEHELFAEESLKVKLGRQYADESFLGEIQREWCASAIAGLHRCVWSMWLHPESRALIVDSPSIELL